MINKHEKVETNEESPILIDPNGVKSRIVFEIKCGYKLDKNSKNVSQLDQVEYVFLHCNIVENDYLQNSKLLYEFVPDKKFGQLISVKPPAFIQCKTSDSMFDYIEILFTDQNIKSLQIEDKVSLTLIIQNNRL